MDQPITKQASTRAPDRKDRPCENCGTVFTPSRGRQVFCQVACKSAAKDRAAVRGKVILPLALAWRAGRGSKDKATTTRAFRELCAMLDRYAAEDAKAGRVAPVKALARQYRHEVRRE